MVFDNIKLKGKRIVVVCLGNELRNDDGVGPYIAKRIKNDSVKIIDAGQSFENYIFDVINYSPTDLFIVDAAFFGGNTGEVSILDEKNLAVARMVSTHSLPLNLLLDMVRQEIHDINIIIVGIQVSNCDFGTDINTDVKKAADALIDYFNKINVDN